MVVTGLPRVNVGVSAPLCLSLLALLLVISSIKKRRINTKSDVRYWKKA
jgi:hypothetical protein